MSPWWLLGIPILVALIALEGRRQSRKLRRSEGRRGRSTGPDLMGAGMLELQQILQPDRDVKTFHRDLADEDRVRPEFRLDEEGEPKE